MSYIRLNLRPFIAVDNIKIVSMQPKQLNLPSLLLNCIRLRKNSYIKTKLSCRRHHTTIKVTTNI